MIKMNKIIKTEKEESGSYKVTFLNENNEEYHGYMSEISYKIYQHKLLLETQGCNMKTLESLEELIREDEDYEHEVERDYGRLR